MAIKSTEKDKAASVGEGDWIKRASLYLSRARWEYQTPWSASWEICMQVKKQQLELDMEQQTGSRSERSTSRLYIVTLLI